MTEPAQLGDTQEANRGADVKAEASVHQTQPPASPPTAPSDLLNAIKAKHGLAAMQTAIAVMARFYDTTIVTKLSLDQRVEYAAMLKVRLENPEHQHEASYTPAGVFVCKHCGSEMAEPAQGETAQGALLGS